MTALKPCPLLTCGKTPRMISASDANGRLDCIVCDCGLSMMLDLDDADPVAPWNALPRIAPNADELLERLHQTTIFEFEHRDAARAAVRAAMVVDSSAVRECIGLFASVIKSGEPWTEHCEAAKEKALKALGVKP